MATAATRTGATLAGMPVGRRTPRGRARWYLAQVPAGREDAVCERLRQSVPPELLEDAFVLKKQAFLKRGGTWLTEDRVVYPEHVCVVTRDVAALDSELRRTTFAARVARDDDGHFAPMAEDACEWYRDLADDSHVIRTSTGEIVGGVLHVTEGPMVGHESIVTRVDRHKRRCIVAMSVGGRTYTESLALEVPRKS